jgi:hypothetical protein
MKRALTALAYHNREWLRYLVLKERSRIWIFVRDNEDDESGGREDRTSHVLGIVHVMIGAAV